LENQGRTGKAEAKTEETTDLQKFFHLCGWICELLPLAQ